MITDLEVDIVHFLVAPLAGCQRLDGNGGRRCGELQG
jgi:hypothetical protein